MSTSPAAAAPRPHLRGSEAARPAPFLVQTRIPPRTENEKKRRRRRAGDREKTSAFWRVHLTPSRSQRKSIIDSRNSFDVSPCCFPKKYVASTASSPSYIRRIPLGLSPPSTVMGSSSSGFRRPSHLRPGNPQTWSSSALRNQPSGTRMGSDSVWFSKSQFSSETWASALSRSSFRRATPAVSACVDESRDAASKGTTAAAATRRRRRRGGKTTRGAAPRG